MNNMPFVIMNAGAKDIAPDLVGRFMLLHSKLHLRFRRTKYLLGLVYVANILPGLMVKLTGPYCKTN